MTLNKRTITIDLSGGRSDAGDDFASENPSGQEAINCRFDEKSQVSKYFGRHARTDALDLSLGKAQTLVDVGGEAFAIATKGTYRYDTVQDEWTPLSDGAPRPSWIRTDALVRGNTDTRRPDCAVIGSLLISTWEDRADGFGYYQFWKLVGADEAPVALTPPMRFAGGAEGALITRNIHVMNCGSTSFLAFGMNAAGDFFVSYYTIGDAYGMSSSALLGTFQPTGSHDDYAICCDRKGSPLVHVAWHKTTGSVAESYGPTGVLVGTKALGTGASNILGNFHHASLGVLLVAMQDGNIVHLADSYAAAAVIVPAVSGLPASGAYIASDFERGTVTQDAGGNIWYMRSTAREAGSSSSPGGVTQISRLLTTYTVTYESVLPRVCLVSHAGYLSDVGLPFVAVADQMAYHTTDGSSPGSGYLAAPVAYWVQPTIDSSDKAQFVQLGRCLQDRIYSQQNNGGVTGNSKADHNYHMGEVCAVLSTATAFWSAPVVTDALEVGIYFTNGGIGGNLKHQADLVRARFNDIPAGRDVSAQSIRLIGAGCGTTVVDGVRATQNTPDAPAFVGGGTAANTDGSYGSQPTYFDGHCLSFRIAYRWYDAQGNRHRSSPSSPAVFANTYYTLAGPSYAPVRLRFPRPYPSGLMGDGYLVHEVEVYGQRSGSQDWRLLGIVIPKDDSQDEAFSYVLLMDGILAGGVTPTWGVYVNNTAASFDQLPQLYTDAGELGAWPTPPLLDLCSTQSRLWGLSAENRLQVWFTKPIAEGFAPEFAAENVVSIPQEGGDCVAIAALDDKVVVFKQRRIFLLFGDPGNANGEGSSLQRARLVSADVGCVSTQSVVEGPFGVAFLSERGFYTLSRGEELSFVGEAIKNFLVGPSSATPFVVTSGTLVPYASEVRWTTAYDRHDSQVGGNALAQTLVWNYRLNKWSTWSLLDVADAAIVGGVWSTLVVSGVVLDETPNTFAENMTAVQDMTASWIKLGGLAGFQRVWAFTFLMRWFGIGNIAIYYRYDYAGDWTEVHTFGQSTLATLVDATTGRVELRVKPARQKCEAIQIRIVESAQAPVQGWELIGVTAEVGVKKGAFKRLPAAARG